jgi:5-methylcytosine-specific restriction protein A
MAMTQTELDRLSSILTDRYGLRVKAEHATIAGMSGVAFRPEEIPPSEGFKVFAGFGWRSLEVRFIPGSFSAPLIDEMGKAGRPKKMAFSGIVRTMTTTGAKISLNLNRMPEDPEKPDSWPQVWNHIDLSLVSPPLLVEPDHFTQTESQIIHWGGGLLGMILLLLPTEENITDPEQGVSGLPEGAKTRVEINRYERNRINRAACLAVHGTRCTVCNFSFRDFYGSMGSDFIHVHHIVPVSALGKGYVINPVKDLVPLCPNCHAMIHRIDPPLSPEELRQMIRKQSPFKPVK